MFMPDGSYSCDVRKEVYVVSEILLIKTRFSVVRRSLSPPPPNSRFMTFSKSPAMKAADRLACCSLNLAYVLWAGNRSNWCFRKSTVSERNDFKSRVKTSDYHEDVNYANYMTWLECVYHSLYAEDQRTPSRNKREKEREKKEEKKICLPGWINMMRDIEQL
jgi:hypothetical protein